MTSFLKSLFAGGRSGSNGYSFLDQVDRARDLLRQKEAREEARRRREERTRRRTFQPVLTSVEELIDCDVWLSRSKNHRVEVDEKFSFEDARELRLIAQPEIASETCAKVPHPTLGKVTLKPGFLSCDAAGLIQIRKFVGGSTQVQHYEVDEALQWLAAHVAWAEQFADRRSFRA